MNRQNNEDVMIGKSVLSVSTLSETGAARATARVLVKSKEVPFDWEGANMVRCAIKELRVARDQMRRDVRIKINTRNGSTRHKLQIKQLDHGVAVTSRAAAYLEDKFARLLYVFPDPE